MPGAAEPPDSRPGRLLANRDFARLFAAQATSLVGSGVTSVALATFAYRLTGSDATVVVGTALTLVAIPSVGLLAEHTEPEERGRAYAAHFALTHVFWLITYPASGYLARAVGTPWTFTLAGIFCAVLTLLAIAAGRGRHREHPVHAA